MKLWLAIFASLSLSASAASVLLVAEGDSITQGNGSTGGSNYVFQLGQFVNSANLITTNIGLSGDLIASNTTASDTTLRLASATNYFRSLAILEMGINDITSGTGIPAADIQTNYLLWIASVRAASPSTKIVMFTVMHRAELTSGSAKAITRTNVNNWILSNAPVDLVVDQASDARLASSPDTNYFSDNVHPNNLGYWVMASNVFYRLTQAGYLETQRLPILNVGTLIKR